MSASRKLGREDARKLAEAAERVIVSKGKRVAEYDEVSEAVVDGMLGSTGNLRAPLVRVGTTVIVGFHDEVYARVLG